jgi:hypothetical protein
MWEISRPGQPHLPDPFPYFPVPTPELEMVEHPPLAVDPFSYSGIVAASDVTLPEIPHVTPSPASWMSALSSQDCEWETPSAQPPDEFELAPGPVERLDESMSGIYPQDEEEPLPDEVAEDSELPSEPYSGGQFRMSSIDRPSPRARRSETVRPSIGVRPEAPRPADIPVRGPYPLPPERTALSPVSGEVRDRPRRTRPRAERPAAEEPSEQTPERPACAEPREQPSERPAEATEVSEPPAEATEIPELPVDGEPAEVGEREPVEVRQRADMAERSADRRAVIETVPAVREGPAAAPIESLLSQVREFDRSALTLLAHPAQLESSEWQLVETRLERVAGLIDRLEQVADLIKRLERLPLVLEAKELAAKLTQLGRTDVRACLRKITQVCQRLGAPDLRWETDTDGWIALLDAAIRRLEQRGNPEVTVLRGPGGLVEGKPPPRAIKDLTVRDSRAVTYGVGNTLHVVHRCAVERPVIEVASLLDYDEATDTDSWFHSAEPVRAAGAEDMRTRITHSSGVSIGNGNHQRSVFTHRIPTCAVNLGVVVSIPSVRQAILDHRVSGGTPETMTALQKAVRRAVHGVDVSALVPDSMVARMAAAQEKAPSLRGYGPTLTIRHGAGVAVGWDTEVIYGEQYHIGKPKVQ